MHRAALFSPSRRFRYRLGRRWSEGPTVCFVLLNPSTANEVTDDATIRRCTGFAQRHGFGGLEIVNLYAYRATDPNDLRKAGYPVGRENDEHVAEAAQACDAVVLAWGAHSAPRQRAQEVLQMLRALGIEPYCLRVTGSGHPEHPLRLPAGCGLRAFEAEVGKVEKRAAPPPERLGRDASVGP